MASLTPRRAATLGALGLGLALTTPAHAASHAQHNVTCGSGQAAVGQFRGDRPTTWTIWGTYSTGQSTQQARYAVRDFVNYTMTVPGTSGWSIRQLHVQADLGNVSAVGNPSCRNSGGATTTGGATDPLNPCVYSDTLTDFSTSPSTTVPWVDPFDHLDNGTTTANFSCAD